VSRRNRPQPHASPNPCDQRRQSSRSDPAGRVKGLGLSERRACRITSQHRSTQRHERAPASEDAALRTRLRELSRERPRWGYRRATRGSAEMNGRGRPGTLYGGE